MATDKWLTYGDVELFNLSRTAQLAETLGIDTVLVDPASVSWIESALDGEDYGSLASAPWYDAGYPASAEFAGVMPLSISGLDDSTLEATTTQHITSGGSSGRARNATLSIVAKVAVVASTARGADFGKRWLDRVLAGGGARKFCSGSTIEYFRWPDGAAPKAHRNDVSLTRGTSVVSKRSNHCSHVWNVTYTWTANDPFEYGDEQPRVVDLGTDDVSVDGEFGSLAMVEESCPVYDYTPIYDPNHPTLVAPPTVPTYYPEDWGLFPGVTFTRFWARVSTVEPSSLNVVPVVTLNSDVEARMVRVSIWGADAEPEDLCDPLWHAVVVYMPAGLDFVIDGEQEASYAWDGVSPMVRRTDGLVYGNEGVPLTWSAFGDPSGLLVTLDIVSESGEDEGGGTVRAALSLVPKSD